MRLVLKVNNFSLKEKELDSIADLKKLLEQVPKNPNHENNQKEPSNITPIENIQDQSNFTNMLWGKNLPPVNNLRMKVLPTHRKMNKNFNTKNVKKYFSIRTRAKGYNLYFNYTL